MTSDAWSALAVFLLLCLSAGIGVAIRPRLREHHRTHETVEAMHLMITTLVTFTALVLGLLIASVKNSYNEDGHDRQQYALQLVQFDVCLRNYGPDAAAARDFLKTYTANLIASTWPNEPKPAGFSYPDLKYLPRFGISPIMTTILNDLDLQLLHLAPADSFHAAVLSECRMDFRNVLLDRQAVAENSHAELSTPFYDIMVFWLSIVFACLGLVVPRNAVAVIGIGFTAVSLSLAIFVIADLSHPYNGLFSIPSEDMRTALAQMMG